MSKGVCKEFINLSEDGYKPLACKPLTVISENDIGGRGLENAYKFFFLAKRDTIRENATLDVIFPTPSFIRNSRFPRQILAVRVTTTNKTRITTTGKTRVTESK